MSEQHVVEEQEDLDLPEAEDVEDASGEDNILRLSFSPNGALRPLGFSHNVFTLEYLNPKNADGQPVFPSEQVARKVMQVLVNGGKYTRLINGPSSKVGYEVKKLLAIADGIEEPTSKDINKYNKKHVDPWRKDNADKFNALLSEKTQEAIASLYKGDISDAGVRTGDEYERMYYVIVDRYCVKQCADAGAVFPANFRDEVVINGAQHNKRSIRAAIIKWCADNGIDLAAQTRAALGLDHAVAPTNSAF
jgi:hypothetical protein